jgi:AraC-like DNA-binding protein
VLEEAAAVLNEPFLGAKFGADFKPSDLGPMGVLFTFSPTIREGLSRLSRYVNSLQSATNSGLIEDGQYLIWNYRIADKSLWPRRQDAEYTLSTTCHLVRSCFKIGWNPLEVHFEHDAPENTDLIRKMFKAPVKFSQSSNRILIDRDEADKIYRVEDKQLTAILERHVADLINQTSSKDDIVTQVKTLIERYLGRKTISVAFIANELDMSRRTLQRHLEKSGVSVNTLVREHRQELAKNLLSTHSTKVSDIAQALGYVDGSVFCRAFKEWNGHAPTKPDASSVEDISKTS